jgi:hypothetical protein
METRLTKQNVMYHLINFSKNNFLSSEYFCNHLVLPIDKNTPEGRKLLEKVQRDLAKLIGELITDMKTTQDKRRIVSCGDGYKIAVNPEEIKQGESYLFSKIKDQLDRIAWLKEGYNEMVHSKSDKVTEDMFA